jgi:hypothetical protein
MVVESVLSHHSDPRADFPAVTQDVIHLRPKADKEPMRDIVMGPDHKTPVSGRVDLPDGGYRLLYFTNGILASSLEYYPLQPGQLTPQLKWDRTFMPDGRRPRDVFKYRLDTTLELEGHRLPNQYWDQREYGLNKLLKRHIQLTEISGAQVLEELFYDSGVMQQRTVLNDPDRSTEVWIWNELAQLTEHDLKALGGANETNTKYFPASGQVHILAEKDGQRSLVTVNREDGSQEQAWDRGEQTMAITYFDGKSRPIYRQNLLLYRTRVGAEPKMSDYRVFSLDLLDKDGAVKAELAFTVVDVPTPMLVLVPIGATVQTNPFVGTEYQYRPSGTLAEVVQHDPGAPAVNKEHHEESEGLRYKFDQSYLTIPAENLALKPAPLPSMYYGYGGGGL